MPAGFRMAVSAWRLRVMTSSFDPRIIFQLNKLEDGEKDRM